MQIFVYMWKRTVNQSLEFGWGMFSKTLNIWKVHGFAINAQNSAMVQELVLLKLQALNKNHPRKKTKMPSKIGKKRFTKEWGPTVQNHPSQAQRWTPVKTSNGDVNPLPFAS